MNVPAVAVVNETSEAVNPVTVSEKVNVKIIAELFVGPEAGVEVIATVGAELSNIMFHWVAAVLPLPAVSFAMFDATLAVTLDPVAVMANV